jgi:hypothetical protein
MIVAELDRALDGKMQTLQRRGRVDFDHSLLWSLSIDTEDQLDFQCPDRLALGRFLAASVVQPFHRVAIIFAFLASVAAKE